MDTTIGAPVPTNVDELSIPDLHKLHYSFDLERQAIRAKQITVKDILTRKYAIRDLASRAPGTDLVVRQGAAPLPTIDEAKASLSMIAKGIMSASDTFIQKLKDIVAGEGK